MIFTKPGRIQVLILLILIIGVAVRVKLYGDPHLSIATNDTVGYITSAQAPITSWEIFTGRRLFTTNILYKFFEPKDGYQILVNGSDDTTRRVVQPYLEYITVLQFVLSIFSWGFLALTVSKFINSSVLKVLSVILILLFAFTPQIAEWDSVLMSESLTFSLFALQLAFLIRILFLDQAASEIKTMLLLASWMVVHFLWIFTRDTNLFAIPASITVLTGLWFLHDFKKKRQIAISIIVLLGIFMLGWYTARNSVRSTIEIGHVFRSDLLSSPSRISILQDMGMPSPDSPEYPKWFEKNSVSTFINFMASHPGYVVSKFGKDILQAFGENMQAYFKVPELGIWRGNMILVGNVLHPKDSTPLFMSAMILGVMLYSGWNKITKNSIPWAWLGVWLFSVASLTVFISIMVGATGLFRHTLFSTMLYRLSTWLFLIIIMDLILDRNIKKEAKK